MLKRVLAVASMLVLGVSSAQAQAPLRVCAIVVEFTDSVAPWPGTLQITRDDFAQADAYASEVSYGQFTQQSDVFGIYRVALDNTATSAQIAQAAQAAAVANGVDLSPCQMFFYTSPGARLPGHGYTSAGAVFYESPFPERVHPPGWALVSHELGHALHAFKHEHALVCSDGPQQGSCMNWEYGSNLGVMAYPAGQGHVGAPLKIWRGWLNPTVVTASGDYLIAPYETSPSALVVTGGTKQFPTQFTLEYRTPFGFDSFFPFAEEANVFNGVVIHKMESLNHEAYLLRMNPSIVPSRVDRPALEVGQTWCEYGRKLSVTTLSVGPAGAMVRVRYGNCR